MSEHETPVPTPTGAQVRRDHRGAAVAAWRERRDAITFVPQRPHRPYAAELTMRVPWDPAVALAGLRALRSMIENLERTYVAACRDQGQSWSDIGWALGVTPQAAHARYVRRAAL